VHAPGDAALGNVTVESSVPGEWISYVSKLTDAAVAASVAPDPTRSTVTACGAVEADGDAVCELVAVVVGVVLDVAAADDVEDDVEPLL